MMLIFISGDPRHLRYQRYIYRHKF